MIVLGTTDATSRTFRVEWDRDKPWLLLCDVHAGGTWALQTQAADGDPWVPVDGIEFDAIGAVSFAGGGRFRFAGGTTGAQIRVLLRAIGPGGPYLGD
ncbi:MAG: hypothetical protein F4X35_03040 [Alphaproteobacteria bacterium]|nr:hypothetical protein [Alphaproteobacteria bacterium]